MFFLFCLTLALVPLSAGFIEYEIGVVTFAPYTLFVVILLPMAIVRAVRRPVKFGFRMQDVIMVLLALSFLQSTLLSDSLMQTGRLAFHAIFIPIASYMLVKAFVTNEKEYKVAVNFLLFSITLFSLVTIYEFSREFKRPFVLEIPPIGVATLLVIPVVYAIYDRGKVGVRRLGQLMVTGAALVLTFSRVYILMLFVSPVIFKLLKKYAFRLWILMFCGTLALTLSITYLVEFSSLGRISVQGHDTVERIYDFSHFNRALSGRTYVYRESLSEFSRNMVFGTGIEAGELQITPHNYHVEWLQYGGVVGYTLYIALFLFHVKSIEQLLKNDRYLLINNLLLLCFLLNSLTNGFMHGIMPYVIFILLGMSEARLNISKSNSLINNQPNQPLSDR